MTPIRAHLRQATAGAHERLDREMGRFDLRTEAGLGAFLLVQARALGPVEKACEAAGVAQVLPDWADRTRRSALARDLAALGLSVTPGMGPLTPPDPAALWGMAYVLEGSRLGARVLRRLLPAQAVATAFLDHGANADLWRSFLVALESAPDAQRDPAAAVAGAHAAFDAFERAAAADLETFLA